MNIQSFINFLQGMSASQRAELTNVLDPQLASDVTAAFLPASTDTLLDRISEAMSGDMVLDISPATVAPEPTSSAWDRTVTITLKNAAGDTHTWFNATIASGHSIADTSTAGTATCDPETDTVYVNGIAVVNISGDEEDWLNAETDTLTVADLTIMGTTVTGGTSVETFTA